MKNKQWRLAKFPTGLPQVTDWTLSESDMPTPQHGQLLVRAIYLDVAPYMRGRISPQQNYAAGVSPGDVMVGGAIGEVIKSETAEFSPGDLVVTDFAFGWQEYAVLSPASVRRIVPGLAPLPYWLDAFGLNGLTAYFSLFEAAQLRAGDTVAISAAAGSVGQTAGQLAQLANAQALAFTSTDEKAKLCTARGYAHVINYRTTNHLEEAVRAACPQGVDVFIDNTGGIIHDAVMQNLALDARVVIVGTASLAAQFEQPDVGQRFLRQMLVSRATMRGFMFLDYQARHEYARKRLMGWYQAGHLKSEFDIAQGIAQTPDAFLRLLTSKNTGKQLVQVGAEP